MLHMHTDSELILSVYEIDIAQHATSYGCFHVIQFQYTDNATHMPPRYFPQTSKSTSYSEVVLTMHVQYSLLAYYCAAVSVHRFPLSFHTARLLLPSVPESSLRFSSRLTLGRSRDTIASSNSAALRRPSAGMHIALFGGHTMAFERFPVRGGPGPWRGRHVR